MAASVRGGDHIWGGDARLASGHILINALHCVKPGDLVAETFLGGG